ncbi:hypothetical protein SLE2022_135890 [Rubroshorea leprosula]
MEARTRTGFHDLNMASRKAEEAALRRYVAAAWLESFVGPLGISSQPSEREFISCLRNGLILCTAINKIQPGSVPKVVESNSHLQSHTREFQPPRAYQYFENVRNFLVAIEEFKLPAFEASDLERDALEAGAAGRVVDCILALKAYNECKQIGGNGYHKQARSPLVMHSASRIHSRASSDSCRRLEMFTCAKQLPSNGEMTKLLEDSITKVLSDYMDDTKENFDNNLLSSFHRGNSDSIGLFINMLSSLLEEHSKEKIPEMKNFLRERSTSAVDLASMPPDDVTGLAYSKGTEARLRKGNGKQRSLVQMQEKELLDLKALLSKTKREFEGLQIELHRDLKELGNQVGEMSTAALGYHKVVEENRKLYNMVQDLKGNIRVFCRIRPAFCAETKNVIHFIGEDGTLVVSDPSKLQKDGRKVFQFNHVFGPSATQGDVFKETQPLIRSVMDGYNVCIFAYGQTGSGKTYTMSGPSGGSTEDLGINYLALNDLFLISKIRSCTSDNGLNLPDAKMHHVNSTNDILDLMKFGEVNRVVSSTAMNDRSSRSHSVLTVHVHGQDVSGNILRSCLHLVDLAGSERVDKSEVTGDRLKEAQHINKSLSCLGDVITALAQKNSHIPYRNSKLTLLLQDSLGGHAKTLMFAHVSPEEDSFPETVSTLKFAQRVSTVELGAARLNKESSEVMKLKDQIESLKKALANKEAQGAPFNKIKDPRSPREKMKAVTDRTPPRARRLSIENGSAVKTDRMTNTEVKKGPKSPSIPSRARRLSLEGPRYERKDNIQIKPSDNMRGPLNVEAISIQNHSHVHDPEAATRQYGHQSNGGSMMETYLPKVPRSPTSSSFQYRALKTDGRIQVPKLQLPKTPEKQAQIAIQSELTPTDSRTTNGKGSQIRKSIRTTIGKLISGSERRVQPSLAEAKSPVGGENNNNNDGKSPLTANARAMRRQSLTGIQTSGPERSRRSSLGGKPIDSNADHNKNSRTPPSVQNSTKTSKRWL